MEFLDELPRNATGKVLKKELKEREEGGENGDEPKRKSGGKRKKAAKK